MDNDTFLSVESLSFGYTAERLILKNINMRFRRGSVVALMGGSGSGKTTVLRAIGAQIRPQSGRVMLDGADVHQLDRHGLAAARKKIGMLFQHGALFTDLSVYDNVAFPLREHTNLPRSMIRDLVLMKLHAVGLRGASRLMPSEISGGMARRVALARSIALDPPFLMYDEPFAGLDPISLGTIAHLVRSLNSALGATTMLVTHDVAETFRIVDYAYVMSDGTVIAEGTPAELQASTDPKVIQFLNGRRDGPVQFHYPAEPIAEELGS
ncbi:MAG TPA: ABC transporter ATP-binding protein [Lautropia sp.]|nr:ABC transporter ATP-binding protein [Lautropia sp.]